MAGSVNSAEFDSGGLVAPNMSGPGQVHGYPSLRFPEQLRLHPVLEKLGCFVRNELNETARLRKQLMRDPILISTDGTILAGFGPWRLAVLQGSGAVQCIEYPLNEQESLQFILTYHQRHYPWNAFVRIYMALTLEPYFQQRSQENMRLGGKYKGLATLPNVQHIDVRQEIAMVASVGARNVSNVKHILQTAHPRLIEALRDGILTINSAMGFCKLAREEQLAQFIRRCEERAIQKVIHKVIHGTCAQPKEEKTAPCAATVLNALQLQEARKPGSVVVRVSGFEQTVVLLGRDLQAISHSQRELKLT